MMSANSVLVAQRVQYRLKKGADMVAAVGRPIVLPNLNRIWVNVKFKVASRINVDEVEFCLNLL